MLKATYIYNSLQTLLNAKIAKEQFGIALENLTAKKIAPQHVGLFESYESPQHLLDCLQDSLMDIPVEEIFIVGSVAFELKS